MRPLLERRANGSLACFIGGNLQFDSRDEALYHEALVFPALASARARRSEGTLRALVLGGGDGLVCRELLKDPDIEVTLVEIDPAMLELARTELAQLNGGSLDDPRVTVHCGDAWDFVECAPAGAEGAEDLAIVDLTFPTDLAGARFFTIEFYERLGRLLAGGAVIAQNACSPVRQPHGFWAIYNAMRAAGLKGAAYHLPLPSFAREGYGEDWGFVMGSLSPLDAALWPEAWPRPARALHDAAQAGRLFRFSRQLADVRLSAPPTRLGGDWLLHALRLSEPLPALGTDWDALEPDTTPVPAADGDRHLLPPALKARLEQGAALDEKKLLERILALLPGLDANRARDMIRAFLERPGRFLANLDLRGLVDRLLQRAHELPARLVAELRYLGNRLASWRPDPEALMRLGLRVITVVTLVVILANLLYPDSVFGKGFFGSAHSLARPHAGWAIDPPGLARSGGFRGFQNRRGLAVDEDGALAPARHYQIPMGRGNDAGDLVDLWASTQGAAPQALPPGFATSDQEAAYRLSEDTDVLLDGRIAISLGRNAYLVVQGATSFVFDGRSPAPVLAVATDPTLGKSLTGELARQYRGLANSRAGKEAWIRWVDFLAFSPWAADDRQELDGLRSAQGLLGDARAALTEVPDSMASGPGAGAVELFPGAWIAPGGSALLLERDGAWAYFDATGWYADPERTRPLADPYPSAFLPLAKQLLLGYLVGAQGRTQALGQDLADINASLQDEYDVQLSAERDRTQAELDRIPVEMHTAQLLLGNLSR